MIIAGNISSYTENTYNLLIAAKKLYSKVYWVYGETEYLYQELEKSSEYKQERLLGFINQLPINKQAIKLDHSKFIEDNIILSGTFGIPKNENTKMYRYWKTSVLNQKEFFDIQKNHFNSIFNDIKLPNIMVTYYEPSNEILEFMPNKSIWHYGQGTMKLEDHKCKNGNTIKLICNPYINKEYSKTKNNFLFEL